MSRLIIVEPLAIAAVASPAGSGAANLATPDPKEVWADSTAGRPAVIQIDLGAVRTIDTIFLGYLAPPAAAATWSIATGVAGAGETAAIAGVGLCAAERPGAPLPPRSHALWRGEARQARFVTITLAQPAGTGPLTAGVLVIGQAFVPALGQEWGHGRRPIDTGAATALPSGGFAVVGGARKRAFSWTFGDLSIAEADALDDIAARLGETRPALVVEDPDPTPGLRARIHYGLFSKWRAYERRNRRQTRWELEIEEWA